MLSTLATFDDLRRCEAVLTDGTAEIEFLKFVQAQNNCRQQWHSAVNEAQRLQRELDVALKNMSELETKLYHARRLIEMEKKHRRDAEYERDLNDKKIYQANEILRNEQDLRAELKHKFDFLSCGQKKRKSTTILKDNYGNEFNSTGSLLSDLSVTQSEEDFLETSKTWKTHRPSTDHLNANHSAKRSRIGLDKSRSSMIKNNNQVMEIGPNDKVVAHTRVSIPQGNGPIEAESIIEAIPHHNVQNENHLSPKRSNNHRSNGRENPLTEIVENTPKKTGNPFSASTRQHYFGPKTFLKSDTCYCCQKKIRFGSVNLKCRDCRITIHQACKDLLNIACVPQSNGTPTMKGPMGIISDYAPTESPMVPAIIVHCITEVEARGLNEVGIYRVSGAERDVKMLKERFIRGKTLPSLANVDVHVLCGCVKDFLRSLREPLIPLAQWKDFSNAIQDTEDSQKLLYRAIEQLPAANRDTLAFLMLHFLRVANCPDVKMPLSNIAKVFGPTIVGYSSADPDQYAIYTETMIQANVMENLLSIPSTYWSQFSNVNHQNKNDYPERDYGSTLKRQYSKNLGTPTILSSNKKRFYGTPPYYSTKKK